MPIARRTLLAGLLVASPSAVPPATAQPTAAQSAAAQAGFAAVAPDLLQDWTDPVRQRRVPVRIRAPAGDRPAAATPAPVVIVSHGLGGSRDGLGYLGLALAEAGFLVIHVQHIGTDAAVWRGQAEPGLAMATALLDIRRAFDRLRDIAFVLDRVQQAPASFAARIDLSRIAVAGHSYGAWTVTHMLGERLPGAGFLEAGLGVDLPDPRLRAGVALSPVPPLGMRPADAYDRVAAPILHVTGTQDRGVIEAATPEDRLIPFRNIAAPGVLAVLAGATHAAFAGEPSAGARWDEPTYQPRIARLSVLFLRATLLHDQVAAALVQRGAMLAPGDRIEHRGTLT
jgi:predicted dienelactone hydrolase